MRDVVQSFELDYSLFLSKLSTVLISKIKEAFAITFVLGRPL